jgi:hypothetical protein
MILIVSQYKDILSGGFMLKYNIRTGVQKIKTKTAISISIASLGLAGLGGAFAFIPTLTHADSAGPITFESPTYNLGDINGQNGWVKTGSYDATVSTSSVPGFGSQSLRISDAVTSGSFGDQTFSPSLINEAGETDALNASMSSGTRQPHFEAQFDLASVLSAVQTGMHVSVSPDRGDGARMSYLRFEDHSTADVYTVDTADATHPIGSHYTDGIHVYFDDVQGTTNPANFVETDIATISRAPHTIKFSMDFVNGPSNDVVKIYADGNLVKTGTSWENYYRFDSESNPTLVSNSRTVDSILFRESGAANSSDATNGFLIDNFSELSGPSISTNFQVKPWIYDPGKTRAVSSAWVTHEGIKDAGGSDHALYLTKKTLTATNASSGASVTYSGALNSLGFDYRNDGHCGAGAPRFNVYTTTGVYYFFGCTYGTHTPIPGNPGWTRVTFGNADAFPSDGTTTFPGFGSVTVTGIDVVFDEGTDQGQGFVYLDNIQVNGVYAGKPGLAQ